MSRWILLLPLLSLPHIAAAQTVTLQGDLAAGARVQLDWTGPNGTNDWVGLAPIGSAGSAWVPGAWAYTSGGNPLSVTLPAEAGDYELRYVTGGSAILSSQVISVAGLAAASADGTVTLSPLGALMGGEMLTVDWTGPDGQGDWIGLAPVGAAGSAWVGSSYVYTSAGTPAQIALPLEGGNFELRYVTGQSEIRAAIPISVTPGTLPTVALTAMEAVAGAEMSVPLGADAPRAGGDYLYIARAGAADSDYSGGYVTIPASGPVIIAAPAEAGAWELRYVVTRAGQYIPVGSAALTVTGATTAPSGGEAGK